MARLLSEIFKFIGSIGANAGSTGCIYIYLDEPECPKSLIEK